jgi:pre-mRNA-splicing factor SYF1
VLTYVNYSTDVNFIASQAIARAQQRAQEGGQEEPAGEGKERADAMAALERQVRAPIGFVAASTGPEGGPPADQPGPSAAINPDAINLDDDMDAE